MAEGHRRPLPPRGQGATPPLANVFSLTCHVTSDTTSTVHGVKINKPRLSGELPPGPQSQQGGGFRNGDLVGVLVDADMGKIAFFCNGVLQRWVSGLDCRAGTDM